jgi:hypothetical protein
MSTLRGVITDDMTRQMQQRIEQRRDEAVQRMGSSYVGHPAMRQQRLTKDETKNNGR